MNTPRRPPGSTRWRTPQGLPFGGVPGDNNALYVSRAKRDPVEKPPGAEKECDLLRLVTAAYLARFKGDSRTHTASDLNSFLTWCRDRDTEPLSATRTQLELYVDAGNPPLPALHRL